MLGGHPQTLGCEGPGLLCLKNRRCLKLIIVANQHRLLSNCKSNSAVLLGAQNEQRLGSELCFTGYLIHFARRPWEVS